MCFPHSYNTSILQTAELPDHSFKKYIYYIIFPIYLLSPLVF